ncbi:oligopeptide/dipeptide ABC transporter, ATPase subunit [Halorhabdus utahensis DSM 12940]|uniref:Oligopeptide/dipeptide ABC transporter, ATPase subunit n=1 Tax=Halorhabdus utahensis (strain DSM 12940 / JCM 11049 / AX-2) TaxID=519442 RepID=C7NSC9_HALUD|nr:ABC transporter ATP-binding protein [Halorhabdus utahensis]ACV12016.1 oligopeptide/dipeptide ABC transporter, ATPase subunit [Halorhabdus utahensis DSM 12940]
MAGTIDSTLMEVRDVSKLFGSSQGLLDTLLGREPQPVRAVDGVSLSVEEGEVLGIAGESGCGKTTLGKMLVKLLNPTEGDVEFDGMDVTDLSAAEQREFRQRVQMIFQDPFESLNPRMTVEDAVAEPLQINDIGEDYYERRDRVIEVLEDVGLAPAEPYLRSFPHELSGGERQRVAIARALVVDPDFVVADEPVSMLDVSIRASVLNLMQDLREEYDLTYVFISHDLSLIRYMCDRTAIMYLGDVVEIGDTDDIVTDPKHPYTEALFDAVPVIDPDAERDRANVTGEVPSPRDPPTGCKFHPRCPSVIPPDDWTGSQDAFRRCLQFKLGIQRETLGPTDIPEDEESDDVEEEVDALLRHGLVLDVPEPHRIDPEELSEGVPVEALDLPAAVESALRDAARDVLTDGDYDSARDRLADRIESVCETEIPDLREAEDRTLACHLYGSSGGDR